MRSYLIVDDNRALAENLAEILRDRGDEAVITSDGAQALALAKCKSFHALITDMRMPEMGGAQLVNEIRRIDPGIAVVVLTAYSGESDLSGVQHQGVLAVLPKPVPIPEMIALLDSARRNGVVLVIEDDAKLSEDVVTSLRARGFSAVAARTADETEHWKGIQPFAALLDVPAPGDLHRGTLDHFFRCFHDTALLVMTESPESVPAAGAIKVFGKPFAAEQVMETLEHLHRTRTST